MDDALAQPLRQQIDGRLATGQAAMWQERARRKARQLPYLGGYVARVEIPVEAAIRVEHTLATPGHHTVWGDRATLLACVVAVVAV